MKDNGESNELAELIGGIFTGFENAGELERRRVLMRLSGLNQEMRGERVRIVLPQYDTFMFSANPIVGTDADFNGEMATGFRENFFRSRAGLVEYLRSDSRMNVLSGTQAIGKYENYGDSRGSNSSRPSPGMRSQWTANYMYFLKQYCDYDPFGFQLLLNGEVVYS